MVEPACTSDQADYDCMIAPSPAEEAEMVFKTLKGCAASDNDIPVVPTIGKLHLGLMCPQHPYAGAHDAIPILHNYAENGCPVDCGDNWSLEHIMLMLRRGPHRSALLKTAIRQLRHETLEKVRHKYARIVQWKDIKDKLPPQPKNLACGHDPTQIQALSVYP